MKQITIPEASKKYGIDKGHLAHLCRTKRLKAVRGAHKHEWLIDAVSLDNFAKAEYIPRRRWTQNEVTVVLNGRSPNRRTALAVRIARSRARAVNKLQPKKG